MDFLTEVALFLWHVLLYISLVGSIVFYLLLAVFVNRNIVMKFEDEVGTLPMLSPKQKEAYVHSMKHTTKAIILLQGIVLVVITVDILVFDWDWSPVFAALTMTFALCTFVQFYRFNTVYALE